MKDEEQIRQVIALQKQSEENKIEVSRILAEVMKNNKLMTYGCRIVLDGMLWEIKRWNATGPPRKGNIGAWRLIDKGKVMQ